jgi:flagellin
MPLSINTNIASLTAQRAMLNSNAGLEQSFERLSTGKRINSASDDAAGLAIGKDLESRVSGLNQAIRNVNDGISMVQIAEGTLDEATTILQRMRDLAVQASNGSLSTTERGYLDTEHEKLAQTLNSVFDQAMFDDVDLIKGSQHTITIQSGADAGVTTDIVIDSVTATSLGVDATLIDMNTKGKEVVKFTGITDAIIQAELDNDASPAGTGVFTLNINGSDYNVEADQVVGSLANSPSETMTNLLASLNAHTNATVSSITWSNDGTTLIGTYDAEGDQVPTSYSLTFGGTSVVKTGAVTTEGGFGIAQIDAALAAVASDRATLGATQQQLESTVRNLANVAENTAAAQGRIMDTDYAAETANLTKAQILQQAATSILAQANAQPQSVLSLLQ